MKYIAYLICVSCMTIANATTNIDNDTTQQSVRCNYNSSVCDCGLANTPSTAGGTCSTGWVKNCRIHGETVTCNSYCNKFSCKRKGCCFPSFNR